MMAGTSGGRAGILCGSIDKGVVKSARIE